MKKRTMDYAAEWQRFATKKPEPEPEESTPGWVFWLTMILVAATVRVIAGLL